MNKLEKFAYNLGVLSAMVKDFVKPKANWIIPFLIGMVVGYFI